MKRVSLSLSLFISYRVQREQISGLLFPLKHVSDLMWRDLRFEDRDVEGERGQNQAEMEWKKTGGESKEGETGKERGGRR